MINTPYQYWMNSAERRDLINRSKKLIAQDKKLTGAVSDILDLCDGEIEGGGSVQNEYELALSELESLKQEPPL